MKIEAATSIKTLAFIFCLALVGCDDGPVENAGERVDEAIEETGDRLEDACEEISEENC